MTVSAIYFQLESTNCEERVCACTTIANLASSHANILQLLHANMVKVMAPLLLDDNAAVRRAALGAFRSVEPLSNSFMLHVDNHLDFVCNAY